jgi:hypothetical protein
VATRPATVDEPEDGGSAIGALGEGGVVAVGIINRQDRLVDLVALALVVDDRARAKLRYGKKARARRAGIRAEMGKHGKEQPGRKPSVAKKR